MRFYVRGIIRLIPGIVLAATLPTSALQAEPYCAETISGTSIYSLQADAAGGAIISNTLWSGGTNLGGIATYGKYVLVTDNVNGTAYLRVFSLTSRSQIGSGIELGGVDESGNQYGVQAAGQISVDDSGNVFVVDSAKRNSAARFAKISNWTNPNNANVTLSSISGYSQIDVAGLATGGASILVQSNTSSKQIGFTTWNGSISSPVSIDSSSNPVAIAANKTTSNSYVVSTSNTLVNDQIVTETSLRTLAPGSANLAVTPISGIIGHDVAMISDGTLDYATVIGINGSSLQATRVALTDGLANGAIGTITLTTGDASPVHYAQSSADGKMLWVTSQSSGKVFGLSSTNWTDNSASILSLGAQIGGIATHSYYALVPEPSSLIALFGMGAGFLGILKRKK